MIQNYTAEKFVSDYLQQDAIILNAGSKSTRFGNRCVNVDIVMRDGVDLVCDIHSLPESMAGCFDAVICSAVLQYCHNPRKVATEFRRVLKPGGLLFVEAPWVQGYCPDTPDKWRFSKDGLREVFRGFEVIDCAPGIRPGSALAYLAYQLAEDATTNRYVNFALRNIVRALFWPLRWIRTAAEEKHAGSFILIARNQ